jgi:hypothetical protein
MDSLSNLEKRQEESSTDAKVVDETHQILWLEIIVPAEVSEWAVTSA